MNSQIAQTANGPLEYTLSASGATVWVSHSTSSDRHSNEIVKLLVDACMQVLIPSRPGYGWTPLSVGQTASRPADAIISLLDNLSIQSFALVAISGGGPTGLALSETLH